MRYVAILTGTNTHLDHLGVLSHILGIPLIVTDPENHILAQKFYPGLDVLLLDFNTLSLHYLAEHFDVIFETGKFWATDLASSVKLLYNKTLRFVFCPHGNSDKGYFLKERAPQDISLVYGPHQIDLLKNNGALEKCNHVIPTGNYRRSYYLKHHSFYDALAQKEVFGHFKESRPFLLYAPTWNTNEHPTSFFSATEKIIDQLENDFNLIIKPHPFLIEHHPAHAYALMGRYEAHPSVLFLSDFPSIYPLLAKSAAYIGDYSSIGYDFLAFDKPLFFLPTTPDKSPLYRCGVTLFPNDMLFLKQRIQSHLDRDLDPYATERQKTYLYAFGPEKTEKELREDIFNLF